MRNKILSILMLVSVILFGGQFHANASVASSVRTNLIPAIPSIPSIPLPGMDFGVDFGYIEGTSRLPVIEMIKSQAEGFVKNSIGVAPLNLFKNKSEHEIVDSWISADGKKVNLRKNIADKIVSKHGLPRNSARVVSRWAPFYHREGVGEMEAMVYELPMVHTKCGIGYFLCRNVEVRNVRTVVRYKINNNFDGKSQGVVTTFCPWSRDQGLGNKCPDWVARSPQLQ